MKNGILNGSFLLDLIETFKARFVNDVRRDFEDKASKSFFMLVRFLKAF